MIKYRKSIGVAFFMVLSLPVKMAANWRQSKKFLFRNLGSSINIPPTCCEGPDFTSSDNLWHYRYMYHIGTFYLNPSELMIVRFLRIFLSNFLVLWKNFILNSYKKIPFNPRSLNKDNISICFRIENKRLNVIKIDSICFIALLNG